MPCELDPERISLHLDITIPGKVEAIPDAVTKVMSVISDVRCASGKEFEIEVALNEALANAVKHGCRHDPGKWVRICVACEEDEGVLIIVQDPGKGFDTASLPNPVRADNLYETHGRGVFLINRLMDEVRYERGGSELWMRKR